MRFIIIIVFLLVLPVYLTNVDGCDWEVEILSGVIFQDEDDFEFKYFINRIEGNRTNVMLNRTIEDVYGNSVREYDEYSREITNYHTTPFLNPNLNPGTYLIKGEIYPDCNDTELENNVNSKLIVILPRPLSQDYTNLEIREFLPDPIGNDNAPMPDGEWLEIYNLGSSQMDLENLTLYDNIGSEPDISISDSNTLNNTLIDANGYLIVYMNGRNGFLNNEGFEKIKLYKEDYLIDEVSYDGSKEDLSWSKVNDYWIQTIPTPNGENYVEEADDSSHLDIEKVYFGDDDKARFGDSLRVRIIVYKGDTTKYNLDLYVTDENNEQVSKRSEINIEDKFKNVTMIVPVQLEPNCNWRYPNGTYKIILKGLDETDSEEIEIEGITNSLCEIIKIKEEISSGIALNLPSAGALESESETYTTPSAAQLTSSVIYQSSDVKAKNIGIYFFCAVLLLLIVYLIFKKNL